MRNHSEHTFEGTFVPTDTRNSDKLSDSHRGIKKNMPKQQVEETDGFRFRENKN